MSLIIIKHGIGTPGGPGNGTTNGVNQPRYIAALAVDMNIAPCQIATAEMVGAKFAVALASGSAAVHVAVAAIDPEHPDADLLAEAAVEIDQALDMLDKIIGIYQGKM